MNAVYIASPVKFHAQQTILAAKNKKNILCEVPAFKTIQEGKRIFNELMKMLSLKNFDNILKHINKKNIFLLIFSELKYLDRLKKLNKVKEIVKIDNESLLSILLIDETDSHEYFAYKYSISNDLKKKLNRVIRKSYISKLKDDQIIDLFDDELCI